MTDTDNDDRDWPISLDDLSDDEQKALESDDDSGGFSDSSFSDAFNFTTLLLMPLSALAVYAFVDKAAVVAALTAMFGGASGVATAVATAAWVAGAVTVGAIGLVAFLAVWLLLVGLVKRSPAHIVFSLLGGAYLAIGYFGANMLFGGLPLLVGFVLTTTLVSWAGVLVIGGLVMAGAIALI